MHTSCVQVRINIFSFVLLFSLIAYSSEKAVDSLLVKAKEVYPTDKNKAYQLEQSALTLATNINYFEGIVKANYYLGFYYNSIEDYPSTITHYLEAIKGSQNLTDSASLGWALFANMNLGSIFNEHKVYDLSNDFTLAGITLSERIKNTNQTIRLKFNLQKTYRKEGRFDEAILILNEIAELADHYSRPYFQAINGIGLVFTESEQYENAQVQFSELIPLSNENNNQTYLSYAYHNLAEALLKMDQFQEAENHYQKAIEVKLKIDGKNKNSLFNSYKDLASLYSSIGALEKAMDQQLMAVKLVPSISGNQEYFYIYDEMARVYNGLGNSDMTMFYSRLFQSELAKFLEIQSEIRTASEQYNMRMIVANYYEELEAQRQADQTEALFMAVIIGLGSMLFLFMGYHFISRNRLKRMLTLELSRLQWVD